MVSKIAEINLYTVRFTARNLWVVKLKKNMVLNKLNINFLKIPTGREANQFAIFKE